MTCRGCWWLYQRGNAGLQRPLLALFPLPPTIRLHSLLASTSELVHTHLRRLRDRRPEVYAALMAERVRGLAERHAEAVKRAQAHSRAWHRKQANRRYYYRYNQRQKCYN